MWLKTEWYFKVDTNEGIGISIFMEFILAP